ncbi:hypothetical protein [Microbispora sp. NBRC 16548]|uniref:hypothetical protein n=1 Tax=Microbispora sp. NBRC 16548 TaxID=3030994 RepID=UPI00249FF6B3|nr:hypothetical protein [Microbispora sp. NBRC 16548]GLX06762.1 hypothetical protein Misp03_36890 [Microbispora sp. NBRC 16548]
MKGALGLGFLAFAVLVVLIVAAAIMLGQRREISRRQAKINALKLAAYEELIEKLREQAHLHRELDSTFPVIVLDEIRNCHTNLHKLPEGKSTR